jgi:hypothetical protein
MIRQESILSKDKQIHNKFESLIRKDLDVLVVKNAIPNINLNNLETKIEALSKVCKNIITHKNLTIYPLSYAVIHDRGSEEENKDLISAFFDESEKSFSELRNLIGENSINSIENIINLVTNNKASILEKNGLKFPSLNLRLMRPIEEYAIEIHCENSFISQLNSDMKVFLLNQLDLKNAISFYTVLQAPESGGDLVLIDKTWDKTPIHAGNLDLATRKNKHLFFKNQFPINQFKVPIEQGDMVFFRAAQIWHYIDQIDGQKPRITIGGFLAKSKLAKNHYYGWS